MLIDYTLRKATSFIPYEIFTNKYHGRRILQKKTDGWRYTILKKTASETKYNTGYNNRLEVKHFAVSFLIVRYVLRIHFHKLDHVD